MYILSRGNLHFRRTHSRFEQLYDCGLLDCSPLDCSPLDCSLFDRSLLDRSFLVSQLCFYHVVRRVCEILASIRQLLEGQSWRGLYIGGETSATAPLRIQFRLSLIRVQEFLLVHRVPRLSLLVSSPHSYDFSVPRRDRRINLYSYYVLWGEQQLF